MQEHILNLPFRYDYTKSYPEIIEELIANTPKMAAIVGDKFELEIFRPTTANKSELEVCLYFFPKINMSSIFVIWDFSQDK